MGRPSYLQSKNYNPMLADKNTTPGNSTIDHLPATLDLQEGLSSAGDGHILEVALELKLHPRSGEGSRPQGSVDSAGLLHGLWLSISLETS
jgi:hypothetical protein